LKIETQDWETINENHFQNIRCRIDKLEIEEGFLYRHLMWDDSGTAIPTGTALVFVEKKKE